MKIKNLMLKYFADVTEITVSFDENLTYLIGENGAGKTTIGKSGVWFVLKGLSRKGDGLIAERYRFIKPPGKSAQGVMVISDEIEGIEIKVSRKLLKNRTELKIEASDGRPLDQAWLDSIFNPHLIDPVGFSRLSGKQQALAFGADTGKFDTKKKELHQERLLIGRDVDRLKGVVKTAGNPPKVEMVDIAALMGELDVRRKINSEYNTATEKLVDLESNVRDSSREVERLESKLKLAKAGLIDDTKAYDKKVIEVAGLSVANEQEIKDKIQGAQEINLKATAYKEFRENEVKLNAEKIGYEGKTDEIQENESSRTAYLKTLDLPWPNISITDEGEFRLNDKPFKEPYFSTGEVLKFGARIGSKLKGGLKYIFIPSGMDDKNQDVTFKVLNDGGFQIVAEVVGTERKKDASILLKEMKVVESYDESAGDGLK